jgi:hypothetical protein
MSRLSTRRVVVCALPLLVAAAASAGPQATFELRLAAHESDAVLDLFDSDDQRLDLEIWVQVSGVAAGVRATAFSFFLKASRGGVIAVSGDFASPPFAFGCAPAGIDNEPDTGDTGRVCVDPMGTTAGIGQFALWGRFSVDAVGLGAMAYAFEEADPIRAWRISLSDGTTLQEPALSGATSPPVSVIEVVDYSVSPDADRDGDVDLADYAALTRCARADMTPATGACVQFDLAPDGFITREDLEAFVAEVTGPAGPVDGRRSKAECQ